MTTLRKSFAEFNNVLPSPEEFIKFIGIGCHDIPLLFVIQTFP